MEVQLQAAGAKSDATGAKNAAASPQSDLRVNGIIVAALIAAAWEGDVDEVQLLLAASADVEAVAEGATPLYLAAGRGHNKVVQLLLAAGADIGVDHGSSTPLYAAAQHGHSEVVKLLLAAGANVEAAAPRDGPPGVTPLVVAADAGHLNVMQLLLAAGANVDTVDQAGFSALHAAVQGCHFNVVQPLLQ
jgi:ankyrin repeat protein